ncbi:cupin domain-containing protein [Clostridium amazonitimonense]|uniref:cupin domain-containing protein n=1 Tax=Clostridium amazonitimonense TaxID=1499689 RepID=UPI0005098942|nr:cupin domain-containing protein [Clostridium amazonitimonense]
MYNVYQTYPCPYFVNNADIMYNAFRGYPYPYYVDTPMYNPDFSNQFTNQYVPFTDELEYDSRSNFWQPTMDDGSIELKDYGPEPFVVNIEEATKENNNFRTALWTGDHLQLTLMSIGVGEDIGLEIHPHTDQFIRIEEGEGVVMMGDRRDNLNFQEKVYDNFVFIVPAGKWHNLINTGDKPIKLYSIYAPPQHPKGTVHETKAIAEAAEKH